MSPSLRWVQLHIRFHILNSGDDLLCFLMLAGPDLASPDLNEKSRISKLVWEIPKARVNPRSQTQFLDIGEKFETQLRAEPNGVNQ